MSDFILPQGVTVGDELTSLREVNRKVFKHATDPKKNVLVLQLDPIHYKDPADGKLKDVDTNFTLNTGTKTYENSTNKFLTKIKESFDDSDAVRVDFGSDWLTFLPENLGWANETTTEYIPKTKTKSTKIGNQIYFKDVFLSGFSASYYLTSKGIQKVLTVDAKSKFPSTSLTGTVTFDFQFTYSKSSSLTMYLDGSSTAWDGTSTTCNFVDFKDSSGKLIFHWASPSIRDSGVDATLKTTVGTYYLTSTTVTMKFAKEWIDAATYPIFIDPTTTIQPDATAGKDNTLVKASSNNYGVSTYLYVKQANTGDADWKNCDSLVQFDLSTLVGTTINSATFYFYLFAGGWTERGTFTISRILSGNANWVEGTSDGFAETGASCWNYFAYSGSTPTNWAGAAGCSTSGTDYSSTVMGTNVMGNQNWAEGQEVALSVSSLTEFNSMVSANYGILCYTANPNNGDRFCSSDHATAGYRPKLIVDYTPAYTPRHGVVCHGSTAIA